MVECLLSVVDEWVIPALRLSQTEEATMEVVHWRGYPVALHCCRYRASVHVAGAHYCYYCQNSLQHVSSLQSEDLALAQNWRCSEFHFHSWLAYCRHPFRPDFRCTWLRCSQGNRVSKVVFEARLFPYQWLAQIKIDGDQTLHSLPANSLWMDRFLVLSVVDSGEQVIAVVALLIGSERLRHCGFEEEEVRYSGLALTAKHFREERPLFSGDASTWMKE